MSCRRRTFSKEHVEYLRARIEFVQEHWRAARDGFENVPQCALIVFPQLVTADRLLDWAVLRSVGQPQSAVAGLPPGAERRPFLCPRQGALINTLLAMGRIDEAIQEFGQLAARGRLAPAAAVQLARLLLLRNLRQEPARRDWAAVEKALDDAEKAVPDSPDVALLRAEYASGAGLAARPRPRSCSARPAKRPQTTRVPAGADCLGRVPVGLGGNREAAGGIEDAAGRQPHAQRLQQAQYLVRRQGKEAASGLCGNWPTTRRSSPTPSACNSGPVWLDAAMQVGDTKLADELCQKIAEKQPNNAQVRYLQFERALAAGKQADIEKALAEIERVAGQDSHWLYGKAMLLLLHVEPRRTRSSRRKRSNRPWIILPRPASSKQTGLAFRW